MSTTQGSVFGARKVVAVMVELGVRVGRGTGTTAAGRQLDTRANLQLDYPKALVKKKKGNLCEPATTRNSLETAGTRPESNTTKRSRHGRFGHSKLLVVPLQKTRVLLAAAARDGVARLASPRLGATRCWLGLQMGRAYMAPARLLPRLMRAALDLKCGCKTKHEDSGSLALQLVIQRRLSSTAAPCDRPSTRRSPAAGRPPAARGGPGTGARA